ncbi:MAG: glycosyltransferase family 2 protein [Roseivivax sp.]|nr:glycosyltransferase family 2 protein [Roseivivax sp.]
MRLTAVTCVKNEGPFLLEWIAFHRLLGVTQFLIYSNDCTDGTDTLLDALARRGGLTHLPNPAQGRNYQMEALKAAQRRPEVQDAHWVWIADVDEFANIHVPGHDFAALIRACGNPQAISLSFQFFANGGIGAFADAPVIGQFDRCHNPDIWTDQTAIEVKTLVRSDFPLHYFGAHRPFYRPNLPEDQLPSWTDGSGRPVPQAFLTAENRRRIRRFPARGARGLATLNHYALRSLDSYLVKTDRGDVNREGRVFDDTYWRERNDTAWRDRSIRRYLPRLEAALAALKADPEIAALHDACVAAHRARAAALLADPAYAAMAAQIRAADPLPPGEAALRAALGYKPGTAA